MEETYKAHYDRLMIAQALTAFEGGNEEDAFEAYVHFSFCLHELANYDALGRDSAIAEDDIFGSLRQTRDCIAELSHPNRLPLQNFSQQFASLYHLTDYSSVFSEPDYQVTDREVHLAYIHSIATIIGTSKYVRDQAKGFLDRKEGFGSGYIKSAEFIMDIGASAEEASEMMLQKVSRDARSEDITAFISLFGKLERDLQSKRYRFVLDESFDMSFIG